MKSKGIPEVRFREFDSDWEERKLGEIYTERKERGSDSLQILSVSIHNGVSNEELDSNTLGKEVHRSEDKSLYKHVYKGDLVLNMMRAWQGAFGVVKSEGMVSPAYITAIANEQVYPLFMDFYLRRDEMINQINNLSYGVTDFRKRLYWKSFIKVLCHIPTVPEQKRITSFFTYLDKSIATHQQELTTLKQTKQGFLQKMFPKGGESVPEVRFPGFTGEWEVRSLGDITESYSGGTPSVGNKLFYGGNIPFIRSAEINSGTTELFITEEGLNNSSAKTVKKGDILYALYGATSGEVGISKLDGAINQAILAIKPKCGDDPYFIYQWLKKNKNTIVNTYLQGGQGNLSGSIVKGLILSLPISKDEQIKIGDFFRQLDNIITLHERDLDALKETKKAFLQKMFV